MLLLNDRLEIAVKRVVKIKRGYAVLMAVTAVFVNALLMLAAPVARADLAQNFATLAGEQTSIAAHMVPDRWTIVMIWASDCHVCNREASAYSDFHLLHGDTDAQIIGLSIDGRNGLGKAQDFVSRHDLSFPNLVGDVSDAARFLAEESGQRFRGTPTFLVYDPQRQLRAAQAGAVPTEVIEQFIKENS